MKQINDKPPAIAQLISAKWVQLAVFRPESAEMKIFQRGQILTGVEDLGQLPVAPSSLEWTRNQRGHIEFASIQSAGTRV